MIARVVAAVCLVAYLAICGGFVVVLALGWPS